MPIELNDIVFIVFGIGVTIKYTVTSIIFGSIIAIIITFFTFSNNKILLYFSKIYVSVFRGTPLIIQLSVVYFILPTALGIKISSFIAGIIAFSLNSAAYISEILRAGILAVDKRQFEAAKTLGISYKFMMIDIIIPQAIRNIIPSLLNELINLLKESAIVSIIGETDLMRRAQIVAAQKYSYFVPLFTAGACYYLMVIFLGWLVKLAERKLQNDHY